jgi:hypothetical protein
MMSYLVSWWSDVVMVSVDDGSGLRSGGRPVGRVTATP